MGGLHDPCLSIRHLRHGHRSRSGGDRGMVAAVNSILQGIGIGIGMIGGGVLVIVWLLILQTIWERGRK